MAVLKPTQSPTHAALRTPIARVRGLGSSKEGADHFWKQRVTAISNIFLTCFMVGLLVKLAGADYAIVKKTVSKPAVSILLLLMVLSGIHHMRIGMQVIIEDYVTSELPKLGCLMLNSFFAYTVGLTCIWAVLKLSFGV
jgi:succinate dehydrogenase / fumarate reductase, membrane anchor subunit